MDRGETVVESSGEFEAGNEAAETAPRPDHNPEIGGLAAMATPESIPYFYSATIKRGLCVNCHAEWWYAGCWTLFSCGSCGQVFRVEGR